MKNYIYALVAVVVIAVGFNLFAPQINTTKDLRHITVDNVFDQPEEDYAVYFYQDKCVICKDFEPTVVRAKTEDNLPIYVVDMAKDENVKAWYDWEGHHETYDKVIGRVENNKEILNEGESHDLYPGSEGWEIVKKDDQIIAVNNKAVNNRLPQSADELEISGTPTLIRVTDNKVAAYGEGLQEGTVILDNMRP